MSKRHNKSPFKPASPDSLSKRLSKCKTRRERQNVMLAAQIESEERNRLEQAAIDAAAKAAHDAAIGNEVAELFGDNWIDDCAKLASVRPKTPKKLRKERAVIKRPEPEKPKFNYAERLGMRPDKYLVHSLGKGKIQISAVKMPALITATKVEDKYVLSDKFILYTKLQAMNLRDPETVEKIRQACSSPQKADKSKEDKKAEPENPSN